MKKLNKILAKVLSLMLAVMLVSSQTVFASRVATITQDYTISAQNWYHNHSENGSGGVFLVTGNNELTFITEAYVAFSSNTAAGNASYGGAIEINNKNATVKITSAYFEYNQAQDGGAICNDNGNVTIESAGFQHNEARSSGGAIFNNDRMTIGSANFAYNNSNNKGGAIFNSGSGNLAIGIDAHFSYNNSPYGNAIYNNRGTVDIGKEAIFYCNGMDTSSNGVGISGEGTIYNNAGVITIGSDAKFNHNCSVGKGGVIYNSSGTVNIGDKAKFLENYSYIEGGVIQAYGGVMYNSSGTTNIGKAAKLSSDYHDAYGGVIYNSSGTINIGNEANFSLNGSDIYGGVIYNSSGTTNIGDNANFSQNGSDNDGGVVYNNSGTTNIGDNANFSLNICNAYGGAIYVEEGTVNIGNGALFDSNIISEEDASDASGGGAIYNAAGTIIIGSGAQFIKNGTNYDDGGNGGAIANHYKMTVGSNALFKENKSTEDGGVLYNGYLFTIKDGAKFVGNTAKAKGGAIYNSAILNLIANTKNVEFTGNKQYAGDSENEESNAIYNDAGIINLWASDKADIIFNDSITGNGYLYINNTIEDYQENIGTGKIILNADMSNFAGKVCFYGGTIKLGKDGTLFYNNGIDYINVNNATIDMINGKTANAEFGIGEGIEIQNKLNLSVDADLKNKSMDMFLAPYGVNGEGKLNVEKINIIEDNDETTRVDFAYVPEGKITTVDHARSVLYNYDAKLEYGTISFDHFNKNGYYYTFTKNGVNPETAIGAFSASVGGYATQSMVAEQAFAGMNSKISSNKKSANINSSNLYVSAGNQVFNETGKIERGAWLRPFVLNETVTVGNMDVDNNLYGTLAGIDLPVGQDKQVSFYLGYAGSKQEVKEVKSNQTGYVLGATGMLIKEKWYLGATANMIFNKASVDTDDGTNDIDMNMFGIAVKAGYNYDIGKNWILEPNATLMYGIVNCGEYETALTKVDSLSINNILFEPQVKAKLGLTNGWQPYGLLGYAANLSSKPTVKTEAGDLDLDSIDGYVEFGAGVNKDFLNTAWSCYAQLTGRSGGRSGFAGNFGVKYKF